ncbi:NrtA/SsuA/CpmA family ABC transporter substrate-binding protein [Curvibacter sp. APW13]|uniref:ABC transporter substrate-binding protein n=1 Tax=Curvibacter sp. APW13 TaxID=3077236 RepID=UPI0028DD4C31|nr:NrtA/SsuA/CpmA family ABC transporter substrate-binding protein [Curvibacter sp. APW13]MDT8990257.1 NrtA/SsuA/CpmA family ABC transporter substrate-binding protein [Curvibacter sp. APW13]
MLIHPSPYALHDPALPQRRRWMIGMALMGTLQATHADYFDQYGLRPGSPEIDVGTQPSGFPSGVVSAVMRRDHVLQAALSELGTTLRSPGFRRGADMLTLLADQRLDAALLGDMPTLMATASGQAWVVGLVKQTSTALIARDNMAMRALAGKRIAVVEASSAHLTVLQGLAAAGLTEQQVELVPMGVVDMPKALEDGVVDAFAAWEPFLTIALNRNPRNHVVFRGASSDYFVLSRAFVRRSPQAAQQLIAAFVRALEWMRASQPNLEQAARWAVADSERFSGAAPALTTAQVRAIVRRELLDVPSAPVLVDDGGPPRLKAEFEFLRRLGKLPVQASWTQVEAALGYDGLSQVMSNARHFQLTRFDYRP